MSVRKVIPKHDGIYFITTTCHRWLPLFEEADAYAAVYKWFDHLKGKGHRILAYVIMPNHLHVLLGFRNTQGESINTIIGNGKRFMAYEIVRRLEARHKTELLKKLQRLTSAAQRRRGKLHEVFEPSFYWKECFTEKFTVQKLNYIHNNPVRKKWRLAEEPGLYLHGSAKYYLTGEQGVYEVVRYNDMGFV